MRKTLPWSHRDDTNGTAYNTMAQRTAQQSPANTGFQVIVAHWVDAETHRGETALLSLKEFKGTHGGEEQVEVFLQVIREAGLEDKLGFFTSDNHGLNDVMLHHIAEEIKNFNPVLHRVRCFSHNLNRVAQAFLFRSTAK